VPGQIICAICLFCGYIFPRHAHRDSQSAPSAEEQILADMDGTMKKNRTHLVMFIVFVLVAIAFVAAIAVREYDKIKIVDGFIKAMEVDVKTAVLSDKGFDPRYLAMRRDRESLLISLSDDTPIEMTARKVKELLDDYFTTIQIPEEYGLVEVLLIDDRVEEGEPDRELVIRDYRLAVSKEKPIKPR
jgi:hypothetical protein